MIISQDGLILYSSGFIYNVKNEMWNELQYFNDIPNANYCEELKEYQWVKIYEEE